MSKIFCIGYPKTGTTTLEEALEILNYKVCKGHWNNNHTNYLVALNQHNDFDEILRITHYYDAFADAPWGGSELYKFLYEKYPAEKYILTYRNPEKWYNSLINMLTKFDKNLETAMDTFHSKGRYGGVYFFKETFKIQNLVDNKDGIIESYEKYNQEVLAFFKDKNNLLVLNTPEDLQWGKICGFLGKDLPTKPFPHANKGVYTEKHSTQNVESKLTDNTTQRKKTYNKPTLKRKIKNRLISIIEKL